MPTKLYEQPGGTFSRSAVMEAMNCSKHHIVNNMAHADNTYDMGLNNAKTEETRMRRITEVVRRSFMNKKPRIE